MRKALLLIFPLLFAHAATAQMVKVKGDLRIGDTTQVHVLKTKRGDIFIGRLLGLDNEKIRFLLLKKDTVFWPNALVEKVASKKAELLPPSLVTQRIFASPTAFILKKGIREYHNTQLWFNQFDKGYSKNFQAGIGFMPAITRNLVWGNAKYGIEVSENARAAFIGGAGGGIDLPRYSDNAQMLGFAIGLGVLTVGSKYNFINASVGRYVLRYEGAENDRGLNGWVSSVGGSFKAKRKSDRYFFELVYLTSSVVNFPVNIGGLGYTYEGDKRNTDFAIRVLAINPDNKRFLMFGITSRRMN
ncbi:MAG: hypothetical protein IT258_07325 [Saprospiraceae bacterium]|nr:hypothetical protein [Saprospiraceae bacterium]